MKQALFTIFVFGLVAVGASRADEAPVFPGTEPEHELLKRFAGEWETTAECQMGPDSPPMQNEGAIEGRMLGDRWVVNEHEVNADGTTVFAMQTIGYDPAKGKYVATWADSMMNHLWVYDGVYDEATKTLTFDAEGPNMMKPGETAQYRDTYEFVADDHIITRSSALDEDGEWVTFMTSHARRKQTP